MTYWKGGGGGVGQNRIVLLRYVWEQMCKLILVYLKIHLGNVYHYSVLKGGLDNIISFFLFYKDMFESIHYILNMYLHVL
jgi:hypothetical protein